jgi:hypothetical protein
MQDLLPVVANAETEHVKVVDEVMARRIRLGIPCVLDMILWHISGSFCDRGASLANGGASIQKRTSDALCSILVVKKERHRRTWAKSCWQFNRLPQTHHPRAPGVVDAIGHAELSDFANAF